MANQFLALSLFLMLLSFFIVMNAISTFDETKVNPRMNSVSLAFSMAPPKENQAPSSMASSRAGAGTGDTFEELDGLFDAHISGFQVAKNRLGTQMYVKIPVGEFENVIRYTKSEKEGIVSAFLPTFISMLRADKNGAPYRMDLFLNIPEEAQQYKVNNLDGLNAAVKKVSDYTQSLENKGLPKHLLSAGLKKGDPAFIELVFMKHEPYDALETQAIEDKRG